MLSFLYLQTMDYQIDIVFKKEYARLIAILISKYGNAHINLIEDAVQEAFLKALKIWPVQKPQNPAAWIMRVARNHLLDQFKKADFKFKKKLDGSEKKVGSSLEMPKEQEIVDSQLRMIFACCHPDIKTIDQLLLSLKYLCGFGNAQIARALLKSPVAIEKALNRAKHNFRSKIKDLELPGIDELKERLSGVLKVIYLQFNEGYKVSAGDQLINRDLCWDAIKLAELITTHTPFDQPETNALLALMYFHASRFDTRLDDQNNLITLEFQDRAKWNQNLILQGNIYLGRASTGNTISNYHLEGIIASYHATAKSYEETDWRAIYSIYNSMLKNSFNPVYLLNALIAFGQFNAAEKTLSLVKSNKERLPDNHITYVFIGGLHEKSHNSELAKTAYNKALGKTKNQPERQFILKKLAGL